MLTEARDSRRRVAAQAPTARTRVLPSPRAEARARRGAAPRQPRPVFVDDSGRRRRAARIIGVASGTLALLYVTFVALTFAGLPGLGDVDVTGLGSLTAPAGEADVGADPREQSVPEAVADPGQGDGAGAAGPTAPGEAQPPGSVTPTTAPAAATAPPLTTILSTTTQPTLPGNGRGSGAPGPSSTVPGKGGPPTSLPRDQ